MFTCPTGKCWSAHDAVQCAHTDGSRAGGDGVLVELPELEWSAEEKRSRDVREMWANYHERRRRAKLQDSEWELIRKFALRPSFHDGGIGGGITRPTELRSDLPAHLRYLPIRSSDR